MTTIADGSWSQAESFQEFRTMASPISLLDVDQERISVFKILDRHDREVVCVMELLRPWNKRSGGDRQQYLNKRRKLLSSQAHFVEIDPLRGGPPMPAEDRPACDYSVMVGRVEMRPQARFWPLGSSTGCRSCRSRPVNRSP